MSVLYLKFYFQGIFLWNKAHLFSFQKFVNTFGGAYFLSKTISNVFFPIEGNRTMCTMVDFYNWADPRWVQINCHEKVFVDVFCVLEEPYTWQDSEREKIQNQTQTCIPSHMWLAKSCANILWLTLTGRKEETDQFLSKNIVTDICHQLEVLLNAISGEIPPIHFNLNPRYRTVQIFSHQKYLNIHRTKVKTMRFSQSLLKGLFLNFTTPSLFTKGNNVQKCQSNVYISLYHFCEGSKVDFQSGPKQNNVVQNASHVRCKTTECPSLFYLTTQGKCKKYLLEFQKPKVQEHQQQRNISCKTGHIIESDRVNDLVVDCGYEAEDEPMLHSLIFGEKKWTCKHLSQISCRKGHTRCFYISDICNLKLDKNNKITPCRNGAHLEDCSDFRCTVNFKCFQSFCIPWEYVCDGKWDCPSGHDQTGCHNNRHCVGGYKCHRTQQICIHLSQLCDGDGNCPEKDDELLCVLQRFKCPATCTCIALAIACNSPTTDQSFLSSIQPYIYIHFHKWTNFNLMKDVFSFRHTLFISLHHCNISKLCQNNFSVTTTFLNLSFNTIPHITKNCFSKSKGVKFLLLARNSIEVIKAYALSNLHNLTQLDASYNPFSDLEAAIFPPSEIKILHLKHNIFGNVPLTLLAEVSIKIIDATDHKICCLSPPNSQCTNPTPWYVPCSDLLPNKAILALFIVFAFASSGTNITSFVLHLLAANLQKVFKLLVVIINATDLVCSIYLHIIWISHKIFEGGYLIHGNSWESSPVCFTAFSLILFFSCAIQGILILFSLARLMVVKHPIGTKFKSIKYTTKWLVVIHLIVVFSVIPAPIILKFGVGKVPLGLCSPFVDPSNSSILFPIVAWFVAVSQLMSCTAIAVLHIMLMIELALSQARLEKAKSGENSNTSVFIQLALISISNIICWIPSSTIFTILTVLPAYPVDIVIWTTVVIVPINAIANPIILIAFCINNKVKECCKNPQEQSQAN